MTEEKVPWSEVCKQVGFRDNLYRTCREKVSDFKPGGFGAPPPEEAEPKEDFGRALAKTALPVPPPPPEDWQYEPEGFLDNLIYGDLGKTLLFSGLAAIGAWILYQKFIARPAPAAALPKPTLVSSATTPKAA